MSEDTEYEDLSIPTYVISLEDRKDRLKYIKEQFEGKDEFDLRIISVQKRVVDAVVFWKGMLKAIDMAIENDEDVIIICGDDHEFTKDYTKEYLISNIIEAHQKGVNILLGGIGGFQQVVPVTKNRLWIDTFSCTQFMVIYKQFFQIILNEPFENGDTADGKFSEMTSNKMVLYPFISVQKDFGYSDVAKCSDELRVKIPKHFSDSDLKLNTIMNAYQKYKRMEIQMKELNNVN